MAESLFSCLDTDIDFAQIRRQDWEVARIGNISILDTVLGTRSGHRGGRCGSNDGGGVGDGGGDGDDSLARCRIPRAIATVGGHRAQALPSAAAAATQGAIRAAGGSGTGRSGGTNVMGSPIGPLLTDLYQLTMAYTHWQAGRHTQQAAFDLFFRSPPFHGEYCVFAGLEDVLTFLDKYAFTADDVDYLRSQVMVDAESGFFSWLLALRPTELTVRALPEGTVAFPHVPMMTISGPLGFVQLLESTLLNLVNYASLVATNAARHRLAAGRSANLLEFGLRRAQGPDGAMTASRYAYVGGFDGTSNVAAGRAFGIPTVGTHAHSYVQCFSSLSDVQVDTIAAPAAADGTAETVPFLASVLAIRARLGYHTKDGELAAFICYAQSFPRSFLALVDTYDTLASGVPNFICVAAALLSVGHTPRGIRLDSGDLALLSKRSRVMLADADAALGLNGALADVPIVASNDISETTLHSLQSQGHALTGYGIGTNLVTCVTQPALGGVFKLVSLGGVPKVKLSEDVAKLSIPGEKTAYRLYGAEGTPLVDLMMLATEAAPMVGVPVLCRHPFVEGSRCLVRPARVECLYVTVWSGHCRSDDPPRGVRSYLEEVRRRVAEQVWALPAEHTRSLNPTPYKVSVSEALFSLTHKRTFRGLLPRGGATTAADFGISTKQCGLRSAWNGRLGLRPGAMGVGAGATFCRTAYARWYDMTLLWCGAPLLLTGWSARWWCGPSVAGADMIIQNLSGGCLLFRVPLLATASVWLAEAPLRMLS